jgi:hypothetical protein
MLLSDLSSSLSVLVPFSFTTGTNHICLPGWKHNAALTLQTGSGAAPDGDEDAIVGMIFAVKALEKLSMKPTWYEEVKAWADASSAAFLEYNTIEDSSWRTDNLLLKLGSCWGGWGTQGNNPSYSSPGSYRIMLDYQINFPNADRTYYLANKSTLATDWGRLIKTSYAVLSAVQCADQGIVPNWATIGIATGEIVSTNGDFSGSGTPQNEFGAEASRTIWRVALDAAVYPELMQANAGPFMNPLLNTLYAGYSPTLANPKQWESETVSRFLELGHVISLLLVCLSRHCFSSSLHALQRATLVQSSHSVGVGFGTLLSLPQRSVAWLCHHLLAQSRE